MDTPSFFNLNTQRALVEPVRVLITDPRSQQIRDVCTFLSELSTLLKDHMSIFLREAFSYIMDALKNTNKVMSSYVDHCIVHIITNTTFKTSLQIFVNEIKDSKAKGLREKCIEYVSLILGSWELTDRQVDLLVEAIKIGLQDAGGRTREIAKIAYINLFQNYPKKAERLRIQLPGTVQGRLDKAEAEHLEYLRALKLGEQKELEAREASERILVSRNHRLSVHLRRKSVSEEAVTLIQAAARGSIIRRHSVLTSSPSQSHTMESVSSDAADQLDLFIMPNHKFQARALAIITDVPDETASPPPSPDKMKSLKIDCLRIEEEALKRDAAAVVEPVTPSHLLASPRMTKTAAARALLMKQKQAASKNGIITPTSKPPTSYASSHSFFKSDCIPESNFDRSAGKAAPGTNDGSSITVPPHKRGLQQDNISDYSIRPAHITVGARVSIAKSERGSPLNGTVRYVGLTTSNKGYWVGVELTEALGKNNGALMGHAYFKCRPNFGIFVRPDQVEVMDAIAIEDTNEGGRVVLTAELLSNLLKTKLSKLMNLVSAEIELAELLDKRILDARTKGSDEDEDASWRGGIEKETMDLLNATLTTELDLISEFKRKIVSLNNCI